VLVAVDHTVQIAVVPEAGHGQKQFALHPHVFKELPALLEELVLLFVLLNQPLHFTVYFDFGCPILHAGFDVEDEAEVDVEERAVPVEHEVVVVSVAQPEYLAEHRLTRIADHLPVQRFLQLHFSRILLGELLVDPVFLDVRVHLVLKNVGHVLTVGHELHCWPRTP